MSREKPDHLPVGFAFDRGCFHSFDEPDDRAAFARTVSGLLDSDGLWLSVIGSTDAPPRETGPPQRSARDIAAAVEEFFEIRYLEATRFTGGAAEHPAWRCVMRKRGPDG